MKKLRLSFILIGMLIFTKSVSPQGEKIIPGQTAKEFPTFEIIIDDHPAGPNVEIVSIEVKGKSKDVSIAEVEFIYHGGDADFLLVNKKISILMGYHNNNELVFEGTTNKHIIEGESGKPEIMKVEAEGSVPKSSDPRTAISLNKGGSIIEYELEVKRDMKTTCGLLIGGTSNVKIGNKAELTGLGGAFDGIFKVTKIEHKLKKNYWRTVLTVRK